MRWEYLGAIVVIAIIYWLALGGDKATSVIKEIGEFIEFLLTPITAPIKWMNRRAATNETPFLRPIFWLWRMAGKLLAFLIILALTAAMLFGKLMRPFSQFIHNLLA